MMLRAFAAILALVAVGCMSLAIVGMVTGKPGAKAGLLIRLLALLCFALAVVLNVAAH
jgi:hypothetical protein